MPPPNLAISSQMTMKLGKDIRWVEFFYKLTKIFDGIIVMVILWRHQYAAAKKVEGFRGFAEYLKNGSPDFHQTYVIFRQSSIKVFEIKRLKTGHLLFPW